MSLPNAWIDRIFERLALVYGRDFLGRWEGIDLDAVKDDWADKLAGFEHHGGSALAYALENLPDRAPTVFEFAAIARKGPFRTPEQPKLQLVQTPSQEEHSRRVKAEAIAKLREFAEQLKNGGPPDKRAWARRLIERHESGEWTATPTALEMARTALRKPIVADEGRDE